jgi:hypothetical protein
MTECEIWRESELQTASLLTPIRFTSAELCEQVIAKGFIGDDHPLQVLQLRGGSIVTVLSPAALLSSHPHLRFRVEYESPDQARANGSVRVAFVRAQALPHIDFTKDPFIFPLVHGETFAQSLGRFSLQAGDCTACFVLRDCRIERRLSQEEVLSDTFASGDSMLVIATDEPSSPTASPPA